MGCGFAAWSPRPTRAAALELLPTHHPAAQLGRVTADAGRVRRRPG